MENPIKMDDLGVPLFLETPKFADQQVAPRRSHGTPEERSKPLRSSETKAPKEQQLLGSRANGL